MGPLQFVWPSWDMLLLIELFSGIECIHFIKYVQYIFVILSSIDACRRLPLGIWFLMFRCLFCVVLRSTSLAAMILIILLLRHYWSNISSDGFNFLQDTVSVLTNSLILFFVRFTYNSFDIGIISGSRWLSYLTRGAPWEVVQMPKWIQRQHQVEHWHTNQICESDSKKNQ